MDAATAGTTPRWILPTVWSTAGLLGAVGVTVAVVLASTLPLVLAAGLTLPLLATPRRG